MFLEYSYNKNRWISNCSSKNTWISTYYSTSIGKINTSIKTKLKKILLQNAPSENLRQENNGNGLSSPTTSTIQQQPSETNTWLKRPSNNVIRPETHWKLTGKWSHNLFSFSEDWNMCCYACACWCCFRHEISTMMNEHWCLWFVSCPSLMNVRVKFRQQYGIQVNFKKKTIPKNLISLFYISGFNR
jgi:hypothetical protein